MHHKVISALRVSSGKTKKLPDRQLESQEFTIDAQTAGIPRNPSYFWMHYKIDDIVSYGWPLILDLAMI